MNRTKLKGNIARAIVWLTIAIAAILLWPLTLLCALVYGICGVAWIHGKLTDWIIADDKAEAVLAEVARDGR